MKNLITHPLINRAELARQMFPNVKHANQYLQRKLDENRGHRLTEEDCSNAKAIIKKLLLDL